MKGLGDGPKGPGGKVNARQAIGPPRTPAYDPTMPFCSKPVNSPATGSTGQASPLQHDCPGARHGKSGARSCSQRTDNAWPDFAELNNLTQNELSEIYPNGVFTA